MANLRGVFVPDLPEDDLIEIHDPEIDPAGIMQTIRARIQQRRVEMGYARHSFPTFGSASSAYPGEPEDLKYDPNLYHHLRAANAMFAQAETKSILADSPATRIPILGGIWKTIRQEAHNLVLFYINRAIAHQINVNRNFVAVLNQLTAISQQQQREIEELKAKIIP